jgi:hypothetical protein
MNNSALDIHLTGNTTIVSLRGHRVVLDVDLARMYGVSTGRLNEQVRRNRHRFPPDFAFQLRPNESREVIANCDNLQKIAYSPALPWAFTEHGVLMAAGVLNSKAAIEMSIFLVRSFVELRREVLSYRTLAGRLDALEKGYDAKFRAVFEAIRELMKPADPPRQKIGFRKDDDDKSPRGALNGRRR